MFSAILGLIGLLLSPILPAAAIDATDKYAWSANAGWLNHAPTGGGVQVYPDHLEGDAWGERIGWVRLGTYTGGGTHTYTNADQTTYGVNRNLDNTLSGYGWSPNVGWINFAPTGGGVSIDPATGRFSGKAWGERIGWINFAGMAQNSTAYRVAVQTLSIVKVATTTVLTSAPNPSKSGQTVTLTATITSTSGSPTGTVAFQDGGTGLTGCASQPVASGVATCTTSTLSVGVHPITANYSGDATFAVSTGAVTQTVNAAPEPGTVEVTTPGLSNGVVGIPYTATFGAIGGELPYTYTATGLPDGLTLTPSGLLAGTPRVAETSTVTITVTSADGVTGQRQYPLFIAETLAVATIILPPGGIDAHYRQVLQGIGGVAPYRWELIEGQLPVGLNLDPASGEISGVILGLSDYSRVEEIFTVRVTDRAGSTATQTLALFVMFMNDIDQVTSGTDEDETETIRGSVQCGQDGDDQVTPGTSETKTIRDSVPGNTLCGIDYSADTLLHEDGEMSQHQMEIAATSYSDGISLTTVETSLAYPAIWTVGTQVHVNNNRLSSMGSNALPSSSALPNALPSSLVLPNAVVSGNIVTFSVRDGGFGDADGEVNGSITFVGGPVRPNLALTGDLPATSLVGTPYTGTLTATDGLGPYVWSVATGTLPPGLTLATPTNAATTTLSGTPTQAGTSAFTLQVIDEGQGNMPAQQDFTAHIAASTQIYTVTPTAEVGGQIEPATPQRVADGVTTTFTVITDPGYTLAAVSGCDGILIGNRYTAGPVTADCSVYATFNAAGKQPQTLSFAALSDKLLSDPPFPVSATASSGLPVSFTASGACTVAGNIVTLTRVGVCTLTARQGGDATYNPAPDVVQRFAITAPPPGKQPQTLSFAALSDKLLSDPPFPVSATASSGLPVSFIAGGACTVAGNTVTLTGVGVCTLTAQQGGDATYNPAPEVVQRFAITAPPPVDIPTLSEWAMLLLTLLLSGLAGRQLAPPTARRR